MCLVATRLVGHLFVVHAPEVFDDVSLVGLAAEQLDLRLVEKHHFAFERGDRELFGAHTNLALRHVQRPDRFVGADWLDLEDLRAHLL